MNRYFILGLVTSAVLLICLFIWLLDRLKINWSRRNHFGPSFLLPIFISMALIFVMLKEFKPRFLDLIDILQNNLQSYSVVASEDDIGSSSVMIHGREYYFCPGDRLLDLNKSYRVLVTPNRRIILHLEEVKEITAEDGQN